MHKVVNGCSLAISGEELGISKVFSAQSSLLLNALTCLCSLIVERVSTEVTSHILLSSKRNGICHVNASTIIQTMQQSSNRLLIDLSHRLSIILHRTLQASELSSCLLNEFLSTLSSIFHLGNSSFLQRITNRDCRVIMCLGISYGSFLLLLACNQLRRFSASQFLILCLLQYFLSLLDFSIQPIICILTEVIIIPLSSMRSISLTKVNLSIHINWDRSTILKC